MLKGLIGRATRYGRGLTCLVMSLTALSTIAMPAARAHDEHFFLKPYLQLGFDGKKDSSGLDVVWFSEEAKHKWQLKYVISGKDKAKELEVETISEKIISLPAFTAPCYKVTAHIAKLAPGDAFDYRVWRDGVKVFEASARGRKGSGQKSEVAIFGDCGINGDAQRKLAHRVAENKPDLVVIPGDIAYQYGLFSQYVTNFFPVYNEDPAKGEKVAATIPGVPLMRSIPFAGVIGNHDIALSGKVGTNLDRFPDALGYFIFWNQPLNGFTPDKSFGNQNFPWLAGDPNRQILFKNSAGEAFPTMSNYSFDFGDAHYTCLDGNYYMDWSNPRLREWLANDLKNAQHKTWRILVMHQPPFLLGVAHETEQETRMFVDIAEKYKVDMVIAGHAHCYERCYPLTFAPKAGAKMFAHSSSLTGAVTVDGVMTMDKNYDGVKNTRPKGIMYIVSGEGGAELYPVKKEIVTAPGSFVDKYDSSTRSFSSVGVDGKTLTFKQISEDGKLIDKFIVTK